MSEWRAYKFCHAWFVDEYDDRGFVKRIAECQQDEALARRIARLSEMEAAVAKLPKCWRLDESGKLVQDVSVVPQMRVWRLVWPTTLGESVSTVYATGVRLDGLSCVYSGAEIANTHEAAEAAGKETRS